MIANHGRTLAIVGAAAAAAAVIVSIGLHPPSEARGFRLDAKRIEALQSLEREIDKDWRKNHRLPDDLQSLSGTARGNRREWQDPETGQFYEYHPSSGSTYELCATFDRPIASIQICCSQENLWHHDAGRQCFSLTAPEQRLPARKDPSSDAP